MHMYMLHVYLRMYTLHVCSVRRCQLLPCLHFSTCVVTILTTLSFCDQVPFEALTFTRTSHSLCPVAMTTKSKSGTTSKRDVFSPYWDTLTTSELPSFTRYLSFSSLSLSLSLSEKTTNCLLSRCGFGWSLICTSKLFTPYLIVPANY